MRPLGAIFLLAAGALHAQTGAAVSGKVVAASDGAPVRRATVLLRPGRLLGDPAVPGRGAYVTQTDTAGRFSIANIVPGSYECVAAHSGFEAQPPDGTAAPVHLTIGPQPVEGLVLKLMPLGTISGRVLDTEGQPLPDVDVFALESAWTPRGKGVAPRLRVSTDDRGEFRLFGLYPGVYYLFASPPPPGSVSTYSSFGPGGVNRMQPGPPVGVVRGPAPPPLIATYYPAAASLSQARTVEVLPGGEAGPTDIRLQRRALYSVSGKVTGAAGDETIATMLQRRSGEPGDVSGGGFFGPRPTADDGTFTRPGLSPGSYLLTAQQDGTLHGRTYVEVGDHDVEGVQVPLTPGAPISGTVKTTGSTAVKLGSLELALTPQEDYILGQHVGAAIKPDGKFEMRGVMQDQYHISINPPGVVYIVSVKAGDTELPDGAVDLRRGVDPLAVVVSADMGAVEGKVIDANGQPVPSVYVTLIPDPSKWDAPNRYLEMDADSEGRFAFEKVVPGRYTVFAWKDAPRNAPRDADFRRPFEKTGLAITVGPASRQTVELTVVQR